MKSEYVNREEFLSVIQYMKEDYKLPLLVSLETGLRIGDALRLNYSQALGYAPVIEAKTGKVCTIVLPTYLRSAIMERQIVGGGMRPLTSLVFPSARDETKPIHRTTIYRALKKAAADYVQNVTPHSARKIFAVDLFHKTGDLKKVQKALRHDYLSTTLLYAFSDVLQQFPE